jgi:coproporphyrinogen III oxidase-like Fe-S oxidoreductase
MIKENDVQWTYQDSITIGTAAKGMIKCYGNYADPDEFLSKIMNARKLLEETRSIWGIKE